MRLIDADAIQIPSTCVDMFENCRNCKLLDEDQVREIIDNAPTIEPKRGRWINEHEDGHGSWVGTCDQCNKENRVDNFCPNCGADMRGAENE